ncbi:uncharacterized protein LOC113333633 [Papaver somniferum]|uniref:uncharacterized protein LOC113333633 n=1 Tax=Papaver somniferum TaxID=3469 RepID=UPI000E6FDD2E|nr:uncharacterized protein LOC113333633 [Papaver somniferum]
MATAKRALSFPSYIDSLNDMQLVNQHRIPQQTNIIPDWKLPPSPFYTINYDASFDPKTGLTGIALILRDYTGRWRGGKSKCYAGVKDSESAECLDFSDAVSWTHDLENTHIIFETDLKNIESYINKTFSGIAWENEDILLDTLDKLKTIPHWRCNFIPRLCNKSVDKLAKYNRKNGITQTWSDQPPKHI